MYKRQALYVRTPDSDQMGKEDCRRLQQHIRVAEQAGADISTIYGDDTVSYTHLTGECDDRNYTYVMKPILYDGHSIRKLKKVK